MKKLFILVITLTSFSTFAADLIGNCNLKTARLESTTIGQYFYGPSKDGGVTASTTCESLGRMTDAQRIQDCRKIASREGYDCYQITEDSFFTPGSDFENGYTTHFRSCWACLN